MAEEPTPERCRDVPVPGPQASSFGLGNVVRRARDVVLRRVKRPDFSYVFREAFGLNDADKEFVYVTDGGHWDNLGLVELLRRGCGRIVCLDAAGDDVGKFFALSDAMALARSDLGVEIDIDLSPFEPDEDGISPSDHTLGVIRYPDRTEGTLVFVKAALPKDAPADVIAYKQKNPKFPTQSTVDQFFDEPQFEAYRALGRHAASGAVRMLANWLESAGAKRTAEAAEATEGEQ